MRATPFLLLLGCDKATAALIGNLAPHFAPHVAIRSAPAVHMSVETTSSLEVMQ